MTARGPDVDTRVEAIRKSSVVGDAAVTAPSADVRGTRAHARRPEWSISTTRNGNAVRAATNGNRSAVFKARGPSRITDLAFVAQDPGKLRQAQALTHTVRAGNIQRPAPTTHSDVFTGIDADGESIVANGAALTLIAVIPDVTQAQADSWPRRNGSRRDVAGVAAARDVEVCAVFGALRETAVAAATRIAQRTCVSDITAVAIWPGPTHEALLAKRATPASAARAVATDDARCHRDCIGATGHANDRACIFARRVSTVAGGAAIALRADIPGATRTAAVAVGTGNSVGVAAARDGHGAPVQTQRIVDETESTAIAPRTCETPLANSTHAIGVRARHAHPVTIAAHARVGAGFVTRGITREPNEALLAL